MTRNIGFGLQRTGTQSTWHSKSSQLTTVLFLFSFLSKHAVEG